MPSLTPEQVVLLRRLRDADHLNPSELHDFGTLMADEPDALPDQWIEETYQDLRALGLLDHRSGQTFGASHGRLSPQGRWLLEDLDKAA